MEYIQWLGDNQDSLIKCDQISFIFQYNSFCDPRTSYIGVAMLIVYEPRIDIVWA